MKIYLIFGQRKCSYPGQYAPELLEAWDEFAWDENPDIGDTLLQEHIAPGEFESVRIITTEISTKSIEDILSVVPAIVESKIIS